MAQMWAQWKKFQYLRLYILLHLELRSRERRTHRGGRDEWGSRLAASKKQLHYPNQVLYLLLCNMLMPSIIPGAPRCFLPSDPLPQAGSTHAGTLKPLSRDFGGIGTLTTHPGDRVYERRLSACADGHTGFCPGLFAPGRGREVGKDP